MAKHIGIVACSYEGAALCYRTICNEGSSIMGEHSHPEISMHNHSLGEYMKFIDSGDWRGVADIMISSSEKLHNAGADFLISPDNTINEAYEFVTERSPLPWLHIGEEVAKAAAEKQYRKLLVLGTRFLMEGPVYPDVLKKRQIDYMVPSADQREKINEIIFRELVYGVVKNDSMKFFLSIVNEYRMLGCDAVILGCTEIPLIVLPEESSVPVLDSTRILARSALKYATS